MRGRPPWKLTAEQVMAIRRAYAQPDRVTLRALAAEYGVSHVMISLIVRDLRWMRVKPEIRLK